MHRAFAVYQCTGYTWLHHLITHNTAHIYRAQRAAGGSASPSPKAAAPAVLFLYASQTGTGQEIAKSMHADAAQHGIPNAKVRVCVCCCWWWGGCMWRGGVYEEWVYVLGGVYGGVYGVLDVCIT